MLYDRESKVFGHDSKTLSRDRESLEVSKMRIIIKYGKRITHFCMLLPITNLLICRTRYYMYI